MFSMQVGDRVSCDAIHPGEQPAAILKPGQPTMDAHKNILEHVVRIVVVTYALEDERTQVVTEL